MRIQESTVHLSASHEATRLSNIEVTTEQGFRKVFESLAANPDEKQTAAYARVQKLLQSLIDAILAAMDGKKCEADFAAGDALPADKPVSAAQPEITWQRQIRESLSESEKTTVCGQGTVKTCDGRQIDFNYAVDMARQYHSDKITNESGTVVLRDPLVLSFDGKACELGDDCIAFDLDADGKPEQIPVLAGNSGFLVFDRNGNGKADNGSELFGVASGNGFADLAQLDSDHNGWIDEGDAAFKQLAVWSGNGLQSLAERGVGALYSGAVDAPFSLKNHDNELLGQIRAAGLYLSEAGEVGQMQQVDLAVSALPAGNEHPAKGQELAA
jgi:hypothetical protein